MGRHEMTFSSRQWNNLRVNSDIRKKNCKKCCVPVLFFFNYKQTQNNASIIINVNIKVSFMKKNSLGHWALASWYDIKGFCQSVQAKTMHENKTSKNNNFMQLWIWVLFNDTITQRKKKEPTNYKIPYMNLYTSMVGLSSRKIYSYKYPNICYKYVTADIYVFWNVKGVPFRNVRLHKQWNPNLPDQFAAHLCGHNPKTAKVFFIFVLRIDQLSEI